MITLEQYEQWPDDGNRYELVDGEMQLMTPSPSLKHQQILRELTIIFADACSMNGEFFFAPIDVIFSSAHVRQPDFVFVKHENKHILTTRGIEGAPDLVVEILSPSTAKRDKSEKLVTYQRFGVKEYWIVDPQYELLEQLILNLEGQYVLHAVYQADEIITSPQIDCVHFPLSALF